MKKLLIISLLLVSLTVQAQDYFSREFNHMVLAEDNGELTEVNATIIVEFNVFSSSDIILKMEGEEPYRYVLTSDMVKTEVEGLPVQVIKCKIAGTNSHFMFGLYDDGDLVIFNMQTEAKITLTNTRNNTTRTFNRLH